MIGCNRVDKHDVNESNPSTANLEQLKKTFEDISLMKPLPHYLFFAGDLVMGYTDTIQLAKELTAWKIIFEQSTLSTTKIKLVTIPGNHEMMGGKNKPSTEPAERTWIRVMQKYIAGKNGPKINEADELQTNQQKLTYSFDYLNTHFIILNTDPVGKEWRVPYKWIKKDLMALPKNTKHIFAIGHKAAFPYQNEDGLNNFISDRDSFWNILEQSNCEAMLAAHNHVYFRHQPHTNKTWQIIAGNGGSLLTEKITDEKEKFFGFTVVNIFKNDKVIVKSYGRNLPNEGYLASTKNTPTTLRDSADISLR